MSVLEITSKMIFGTVQKTFDGLADALTGLDKSQYEKPCANLSGSTIGQHVRHVIELFQCLLNGYESRLVNYDLRERDKTIETNKSFALYCLEQISSNVSKPDQPMQLQVLFGNDEIPASISTTYQREIIYNIEHAIHHMALIRIGINEVSVIELPTSFGVAPSTLKYQTVCAR